MKKFLLLIAVLSLALVSINAQQKGRIRGGLDLGYAKPTGGHGVVIGTELKYNIFSNWNAGIRVEAAGLAKEISGSNLDKLEDADITFNYAFLAVSDYYFPLGSSRFAPFAGAGLGYYKFADIKFDDYKVGGDSGKFGGLVRAGFEYRKFRLTATYNMIPKTKLSKVEARGDNPLDVEGFDDDNFRNGKSSNQYFSFSVGFYIGGGSWKR